MSRLSDWFAGAADPVRLAKGLSVAPDPWQARVLRSTAPRLHLNCSRQVGKSTVTSILALHKALYTPGATILIISPTDRQSSELFLKIAAFYKTLGQPAGRAGTLTCPVGEATPAPPRQPPNRASAVHRLR